MLKIQLWMSVILSLGLGLSVWTAVAHGQNTSPESEIAALDVEGEALTPYKELASISGIIIATMTVVQVIKRTTREIPFFKWVPVWVYAIAVSAGLTAFANLVLGVLEGEIGPLIWQAVLAAGSAGGFFTWLREPTDAPADKGHPTPYGLLLAVVAFPLFAIGCSANESLLRAAEAQDSLVNPEYIAYVSTDDTLSETEKTIRIRHVEEFRNTVRSFREAQPIAIPQP